MLKLEHIYKNYYLEKQSVLPVLKDINLEFDENEFVAILGPSGCGKTTLLNIIGGLDRYTSGDLVVDGTSTKDFKDKDWDAYRNKRIGTVFQNYNLITHLTVLGNVELALTLSGVSHAERKERALKALDSVGLSSEANKHPNQLSGGQMQRVAIARAIVNNPGIILADEPTGALDSKTSVQVMDILKDLSKTHLVIMVTHNEDLALTYATRLIRIKDGEIISNDFSNHEELILEETVEDSTIEVEASDLTMVGDLKLSDIKKHGKKVKDKTSMGFLTALNISSRNLMTKKGRTIMTSIAGSFGIIGIALVLAMSNGFKGYISRMETETLAQFPVSIEKYGISDFSTLPGVDNDKEAYPNTDEIILEQPLSSQLHSNTIDDAYLKFLSDMPSDYYNNINYNYSLQLNIVGTNQNGDPITIRTSPSSLISSMTSTSYWGELPESEEFVLSQYDLIGEGSRYPQNANEVVLTVDKFNSVSSTIFAGLGFDSSAKSLSISDIIGKKYKMFSNDDIYEESGRTTINNSYVFKEDADLNAFIKLFSQIQEDPNNTGLMAQAMTFFELKTEKDIVTYRQVDNTVKKELFNDSTKGEELTVVGILRPKTTTNLSLLTSGIMYYTSDLVEKALADNSESAMAKEFKTHLTFSLAEQNVVAYDIFTNSTLDISSYFSQRLAVGSDKYITSVTIYPKNFESKKNLLNYLDSYNVGKADSDKVIYTDLASVLTSSVGTMVDIISYVLIAFAAISLVVSSVMISIITYVSVIERTKEIGILRSIGARKKDVSRLFKAETFIIGAISGTIGVLVTYIVCFPINAILNSVFPEVEIGNIADLNPLAALALIVISILLTLLAGWLPSRKAAKKDPVVALRTE